MKVKGENECYEVEVKKRNKKEITIYLRDLDFNMMAVTISKENWEKLKSI